MVIGVIVVVAATADTAVADVLKFAVAVLDGSASLILILMVVGGGNVLISSSSSSSSVASTIENR